VELKEIEDWNCCGATAYSHIDELLAQVLCARNLALAEKDGLDVVAPCSGCYKNLHFANAHMNDEPDLLEHMNFALEEDDLHYSGSLHVHHLMDMFVSEVGLDLIREKASDRLKGLRVAPYYGCQIIRPRKTAQTVEEVEGPHFFEDLLSAIGAAPVRYPYKLRCCGASLIATNRKAALGMLRYLLQSAVNAKAEVIATACPLCQINLELYQGEVNKEYGTEFSIPVLYFTQLMGLALGISEKRLGIGKEVISPKEALASRQN
jgi:heterodisulfide reductase subunit B